MLRPGEILQVSGKMTVKGDNVLIDGVPLSKVLENLNGAVKSQRVIISVEADVTAPVEEEPLLAPEEPKK